MMREKYELCELQICPFEHLNINNISYLKPMRNDEYPYRLCILDRNNSIAIDINTLHQYDYIEMSTIHFYGMGYKKIKNKNRYAILKLTAGTMCEVDNDILVKAREIRTYLEQGKEFENGNTIDNESYLDLINNENRHKKVKKIKMKRKSKRK